MAWLCHLRRFPATFLRPLRTCENQAAKQQMFLDMWHFIKSVDNCNIKSSNSLQKIRPFPFPDFCERALANSLPPPWSFTQDMLSCRTNIKAWSNFLNALALYSPLHQDVKQPAPLGWMLTTWYFQDVPSLVLQFFSRVWRFAWEKVRVGLLAVHGEELFKHVPAMS